MKKIFVFICLIIGSLNLNAQNDICIDAEFRGICFDNDTLVLNLNSLGYASVRIRPKKDTLFVDSLGFIPYHLFRQSEFGHYNKQIFDYRNEKITFKDENTIIYKYKTGKYNYDNSYIYFDSIVLNRVIPDKNTEFKKVKITETIYSYSNNNLDSVISKQCEVQFRSGENKRIDNINLIEHLNILSIYLPKVDFLLPINPLEICCNACDQPRGMRPSYIKLKKNENEDYISISGCLFEPDYFLNSVVFNYNNSNQLTEIVRYYMSGQIAKIYNIEWK